GSASFQEDDGIPHRNVTGVQTCALPTYGTMNMAEESIKEYNLDMELVSSSEPAIVTELQEAIKEERPIVVTLWQPHWAFDKYDLKILDDPKEIIGVEQKIHTIVRQGLEDE